MSIAEQQITEILKVMHDRKLDKKAIRIKTCYTPTFIWEMFNGRKLPSLVFLKKLHNLELIDIHNFPLTERQKNDLEVFEKIVEKKQI